MRFAEGDDNLELSSFSGFMKSVVSLVIFAPFKLLHEMSLKIVFLRKDLIEKMLFFAAAVGGIFVVYDIFLSLFVEYEGTFLTDSLLLYLISTILLAVLAIAFKSADLMLYTQLSQMFTSSDVKPIVEEQKEKNLDERTALESTRSESHAETTHAHSEPILERVVSVAQNKDSDTDDISELAAAVTAAESSIAEMNVSENAGLDVSALTAAVPELKEYVKQYENKTNLIQMSGKYYCGELSGSEIEEFSNEMDACTDPSKYISEQLIKMFDENSKKEDLSILADLNIGIIPDTFAILT